MQGEYMNGSCCSTSGCLSITAERIGYADASAENMSHPTVSVEEVWGRITLDVSLICRTAQGVWEYLHVAEGQVLDINGEKIMVRRYGVQD